MKAEVQTIAGDGEPDYGWLASWLLRGGQNVLPRWAVMVQRVATLPQNWRRRMRRKLAVTISGAALLLALAGPVGPAITHAGTDATQATINVVNGEVAVINNGKCSLSEAIINARVKGLGNMKADCTTGNISGPDTISLPNDGLFDLTAVYSTQEGPTGLPLITSGMTIEGNGSIVQRSYAPETEDFRLLFVESDAKLTLRNVTLQNGRAGEYYSGGAIASEGELIIENSTITANRAQYGGGIVALEATISGSQITNNRSGTGIAGGRGGGIIVDHLTMTNSTVTGNVAAHHSDDVGVGGGVDITNGSISGSTISGNTAEGGEPYASPTPGLGGGLRVRGSVTVFNTTISGNHANRGGGILVSGNIHLDHSTITGNNAANTYEAFEPEVAVPGRGGGVFVGYCGSSTLRGTLISGNTAGETGREIWVDESSSGCTPVATSEGFNVIGLSGNAGSVRFTPIANDVVPAVGLAAILGPLADNGGPTQTHALVADSPALDLAPSASCLPAPLNGLDQRGQPRNANGAGGASANECDAGSFELQATATTTGSFLISPKGSGNVGGVAFTPADILKFDPATGWSMYFDASDVGVTKNLSAFEIVDGRDILMSFAAKQVIAGVGAFLPQDIARFTPTSTGLSTDGSFAWALDGSANWLTTSAEKIDAIADIGDGRIAISTMGNAAVKLPNNTVLKAQDEDASGMNLGNGHWSEYFDGTPIPGLKAEDVNAMSIDPTTGDIYISLANAFNLGGVKGNAKDIVKLTPSGGTGGYTASLWWDGSAEGFPSTIDGLGLLP